MFGINKFWIWLSLLIATMYFDNNAAALVVWMVGIFYFFLSILTAHSNSITIPDDMSIKSISRENNTTIIILTNGKSDHNKSIKW
jgi:hypothetical protein